MITIVFIVAGFVFRGDGFLSVSPPAGDFCVAPELPVQGG
jgi:hypothetical protein